MATNFAQAIGALVAQARDGIEAGMDVAITGEGVPWLVIDGLDWAGPSNALLRFTGKYGEAEGTVFYMPAEALNAVRLQQPHF